MAKNTILISEDAGVRYLHFGSEWIQGAMRVRRPNALELDYTRDMMTGLLLHEAPWPRSALLIGLGAGSLAKFIYHQRPKTKITVVEIDPQIDLVARLHFKLPDDPSRLHVLLGDGAEYMLASGKHFDYILVDGFDKNANAGVLDTLPFYQACRARLSSSGLLAVNLLSHNKGCQASARRIDTAFDGRSLLFPSCLGGNTIAFATAGEAIDLTLDELGRRAAALKDESSLNLLPTIKRLKQSASLPLGRLTL